MIGARISAWEVTMLNLANEKIERVSVAKGELQ